MVIRGRFQARRTRRTHNATHAIKVGMEQGHSYIVNLARRSTNDAKATFDLEPSISIGGLKICPMLRQAQHERKPPRFHCSPPLVLSASKGVRKISAGDGDRTRKADPRENSRKRRKSA